MSVSSSFQGGRDYVEINRHSFRFFTIARAMHVLSSFQPWGKILPLSFDMLRAVAWLTNAVAVIIGLVMFVCASGELGI